MHRYHHQGDCQHFVVFTDIRLIGKSTSCVPYQPSGLKLLDVPDAEDNQDALAYPIQIYQSRLRRRKCGVCDQFAASYVQYCAMRASYVQHSFPPTKTLPLRFQESLL
jgi:hypothetical protein